MRRTALALVVLVTIACSSGKPAATAEHASPTPALSTTSGPSAARPASLPPGFAAFAALPVSSARENNPLPVRCSATPGVHDPVAVVYTVDNQVLLRDYNDVDHPYTICTFASQNLVQLIDPRHFVIQHDARTLTLIELPSLEAVNFQVPDQFLAVGPGLNQVAWMHFDDQHNVDDIHLATAAGDRVVATLPAQRGFCGSPDDSKPAAYSANGLLLFVYEEHPGGFVVLNTDQQLQLADQTLFRLANNPASNPNPADRPGMVVWQWATEALFYREGGDVWRWAPEGPQRYLPGVNWYYPTISADGRHLAYAVLRADGLHDVYLQDLDARTAPVKIAAARTMPVFLNAVQLWYESDSGPGPCGSGGVQHLIYDVRDGTESPSSIAAPIAVWDATSSNF